MLGLGCSGLDGRYVGCSQHRNAIVSDLISKFRFQSDISALKEDFPWGRATRLILCYNCNAPWRWRTDIFAACANLRYTSVIVVILQSSAFEQLSVIRTLLLSFLYVLLRYIFFGANNVCCWCMLTYLFTGSKRRVLFDRSLAFTNITVSYTVFTLLNTTLRGGLGID